MTQAQFGKRISELRLGKGLTQQDLAEKCNLNVRTIQRIEAGEVSPRMYTLNLLTTPLGMDLNVLNQSTPETQTLSGKMQWAFIAGIVFAVNAIPVVYDLITHRFSPFMHVLTSVIHTISCAVFLAGFYAIGKLYKNWILAVSALVMALLLPTINILDMVKQYYFSIGKLLLFVLMGVNMIIMGAGMIKESLERKGYENSGTYKAAGILMILVSLSYLTLNTNIINAGLILSCLSNLLLVYLLYNELHDPGKQPV